MLPAGHTKQGTSLLSMQGGPYGSGDLEGDNGSHIDSKKAIRSCFGVADFLMSKPGFHGAVPRRAVFLSQRLLLKG